MPINDSVNADMNHSAKEQEVQQYFCPVKDCPRAVDGGKPFPRLGQLKQHFDGVHAEKSFVCNKCGKKFGLKDVCSRHEKECGKTIVCETCGASFKSKNSYTKHLKRKRHLSTTARSPTCTATTGTQVMPSHKVFVVLLPSTASAVKKKDFSTQTDPIDVSTSQNLYDNLSSDITELLDLAIQTDVSSFSRDMSTNELLDFGTQTCWGEGLLSNECSSQTPSDWPECCLSKLLTFDSQTQTILESMDNSSQT